MTAAIQFNSREADSMQGNGPKSVALSLREGSLESPTELWKSAVGFSLAGSGVNM